MAICVVVLRCGWGRGWGGWCVGRGWGEQCSNCSEQPRTPPSRNSVLISEGGTATLDGCVRWMAAIANPHLQQVLGLCVCVGVRWAGRGRALPQCTHRREKGESADATICCRLRPLSCPQLAAGVCLLRVCGGVRRRKGGSSTTASRTRIYTASAARPHAAGYDKGGTGGNGAWPPCSRCRRHHPCSSSSCSSGSRGMMGRRQPRRHYTTAGAFILHCSTSNLQIAHGLG